MVMWKIALLMCIVDVPVAPEHGFTSGWLSTASLMICLKVTVPAPPEPATAGAAASSAAAAITTTHPGICQRPVLRDIWIPLGSDFDRPGWSMTRRRGDRPTQAG